MKKFKTQINFKILNEDYQAFKNKIDTDKEYLSMSDFVRKRIYKYIQCERVNYEEA